MKKAVVIVSGGMDSVSLAHFYHGQGYALSILSFDYGQRNVKELGFAKACADKLGASHTIVDLSGLRVLLPGSSLTDDSVEVPEGHYAADSMKATVVPNRNTIMLSVAYGHAVAIGAEVVAFGAHGGDHFIYPDCRPAFYDALNLALEIGNEGFGKNGLHLEAPFIHIEKSDIAKIGFLGGVDFSQTWSCYKGGDLHCGKCGTCVERKEAFQVAKIEDPTIYEDDHAATRA
jgi:7-cyano-7-deazaguanine synthase